MNPISCTIQALLAGNPITAMVGTRVEPITAPQSGDLPDLIVNSMANPDELLISGPGKYPNARVRIECRARTKTEVLALGDAVIDHLDGLRGTFAGMDVTSFLKEDTDMTDAAEDYSTYRRILDFRVRYRTSA